MPRSLSCWARTRRSRSRRSPLAQAFPRATRRSYWHDWVRGLAIPFEWQEAVIRAAISLKLCTYEDTGAVARRAHDLDARERRQRPQLGLPLLLAARQLLRDPGAQPPRRDPHDGGLPALHRRASSHAAATPSCSRCIGIGGEARSARAHRAVAARLSRHGPGARRQPRLPAAAERRLRRDRAGVRALVLRPAADATSATPVQFTQLEYLGERAVRVHDRPDAGPWEFRGIERVHTFSAAMCWAGCGPAREASRGAWACAERADVLARRAPAHMREHDPGACLEPRVQALSRRSLRRRRTRRDGAAAAGARHRRTARDPRFVATLAAIERELKHGDWLYRYRHPDDFGKPETAFTICAFWYVNALATAGRREEARELFERLLARRTRLGLLSEDIDPVTGERWGNFPQTYSLVGIINSRHPAEPVRGRTYCEPARGRLQSRHGAEARTPPRAASPSGCSRP